MTILAAVSGKRSEDRVVETGYDLASAYGDELVVVHVMEQEQFEEIRGSDEVMRPVVIPSSEGSGLAYISERRSVADYNLETASEDASNVAWECVEGTLGSERPDDVSVRGLVGDPAGEIVKEADRLDARYVVVGGRKRSPAGKALFGSVSQSVILNTERPIVALTEMPG